MKIRSGSPLPPAAVLLALLLALGGCSRGERPRQASRPTILATETFLADITRQVAGDRAEVQSLIPAGIEPHSFEPTPRDLARLSDAALVVASGAGLEGFLSRLIAGAGPAAAARIMEASAGLTGRVPREGEAAEAASPDASVTDPHFYLDPILVIRYVENIRDALSRLDPAGASVYASNAGAYAARLEDLDRRIRERVSRIPPAERMLVTNHESLGYFADRYGFRVIGTIIPSVSTEAAPTARQVARLVERLKAARARAVFLETGANPALARQVAAEAGVKVVTELYTHSLSGPEGPAASYIAMMEYNAGAIVSALAPGGGSDAR
jgi:ABC-type Zn uptake system ZnuABC Zn-binding protein ZnuA